MTSLNSGKEITCEWVVPLEDGYEYCPYCGGALRLDVPYGDK